MRDWDFDGQLVKTLKISGVVLLFLCFAVFYQPGNPVIWGFWVGVTVGMWNTFFLGKRLCKIAGMPVESAKAQVMGGVAMRFITNIAILFLVAMTGWFDICSTMVGLFIAPCIFTFGAIGLLIGEAREAKPLK